MITETEEVILFESKEAAREVSLTIEGKEVAKGWLSRDNIFFQNEDTARYSGCTHKTCECGGIMTKGYTKCESCQFLKRKEKFNAMESKPYDGSPVTDYDGDTYFFSEEEIDDYCEEHEVKKQDLMLVFCTENHLWQIDSSIWEDILPSDSDGELPKDVEDKMKELNEVIRKQAALSYSPANIRVIL